MLTILNLFGRSPFAPLQSHMEKVASCVYKTTELFQALEATDFDQAHKIAKQISEFEHQADVTKRDIRDHLPKSLFLAIDRRHLLEILGIQDTIADQAEDVAILATIKKLEFPEAIRKDFYTFLQKNIDSFEGVRLIIKEFDELLESSFGGIEAEKVRGMVDDVAYKEHEADILQRKLFKSLIDQEDSMSYSTFHIWIRIFEGIASISNLSEKLAYHMRMTLEIK